MQHAHRSHDATGFNVYSIRFAVNRLTVLLFHQPLLDVSNVREEVTHSCDLRNKNQNVDIHNTRIKVKTSVIVGHVYHKYGYRFTPIIAAFVL